MELSRCDLCSVTGREALPGPGGAASMGPHSEGSSAASHLLFPRIPAISTGFILFPKEGTKA